MQFNLSEWALKNKGLVLYFMLLLALVGFISYSKLSQSEDPPFTFKVMVVQTYLPGASAKEVSLQVTDKIEKTLPIVIRTLAERGITEFLSGGALGFDMIAAKAGIAVHRAGAFPLSRKSYREKCAAPRA